jgi:hypothetical protein
MAELIKSVLGQVNGKLNNLVFRKINGKNFISVRPKKYKPGKSKAAKEGRNNFAMTVALSKSVNSFPILKEIWFLSKAEGTDSYHKIIKYNAKLVKLGSLTTSNKITPEGLSLKLNSASFENKNLHVSFICPSNQYFKYPAVLFVYLYFEKENKSVVPVFASLEEASPDGSFDIDLNLDNRIRKIISKDPNPIIYLALAGGTPYRKKVYWTNTASLQV